VDEAGSDDLSLAAVQSAIGAAFQSWQQVQCSKLQFKDVGVASEGGSGRIHVRFEEDDFDFVDDNAIAYASPLFSLQTGEIFEAQIVFRGENWSWQVGPDALPSADLENVALHEIGHAIGLRHSIDRSATMFFSQPALTPKVLAPDDERGACYLYPASPFDGGLSCDSCQSDAHCAAGSCESYGQEGRNYCETPCGEGCPDGLTCQQGVCRPAHGFCGVAGNAVPGGEYCWGHALCESGLCGSTTDSAACSAPCNVDADCPAGMACLEFASGDKLCLPAGPIGLGGPCTSHIDCSTLKCAWVNSGGATQLRCTEERTAACSPWPQVSARASGWRIYVVVGSSDCHRRPGQPGDQGQQDPLRGAQVLPSRQTHQQHPRHGVQREADRGDHQHIG